MFRAIVLSGAASLCIAQTGSPTGTWLSIPGAKTTYRVMKETDEDELLTGTVVEKGDLVIANLDVYSGEKWVFTTHNTTCLERSCPAENFVSWFSGESEEGATAVNFGQGKGGGFGKKMVKGIDLGTLGQRKQEVREFKIPPDEGFGSGFPTELRVEVRIEKIKYKKTPEQARRESVKRVEDAKTRTARVKATILVAEAIAAADTNLEAEGIKQLDEIHKLEVARNVQEDAAAAPSATATAQPTAKDVEKEFFKEPV